jgi:hypothetical protein
MFATKLMAIFLNCISLGLPFHEENKIHSNKVDLSSYVSFPLLSQVVVEYHFFHVGYTLWCLLLVLVASFDYSISLKSWSTFLCASSCVVFLLHAFLCVFALLFLSNIWMGNVLFPWIWNTEPCCCPLYHHLHLRVIMVVLSLRILRFGF